MARVESRLREDERISVLVNNAGEAAPGSFTSPDSESLEHLIRLNVTALTRLTSAVIPRYLRQGGGAIINIASVLGFGVAKGVAGYTTAKAGVVQLTKALGLELAFKGIRVNAIAPGEIDTAMLSPGTEKIVEVIPMHRLGTPDEVAKIIYVLCTETSSYVNGAEIHINGGQHV